MSTVEQDASERRNYKQGGCMYLLNDDERTAWTLIIRTDHVLKLQTVWNDPLDFASRCTLKVPSTLVDGYKKHPLWGQFRTIEAL